MFREHGRISVVQSFEFLWKKYQNQRTADPSYFKNLKELAVFMKQPGYFMFAKCWEPWLIYQNQVFDLLRTMTMNSKNLPRHNQLTRLLSFKTCDFDFDTVFQIQEPPGAWFKIRVCGPMYILHTIQGYINCINTDFYPPKKLKLWISEGTQFYSKLNQVIYLQKFNLLVTFSEEKKPTFSLKKPAMFWKQKKVIYGFF